VDAFVLAIGSVCEPLCGGVPVPLGKVLPRESLDEPGLHRFTRYDLGLKSPCLAARSDQRQPDAHSSRADRKVSDLFSCPFPEGLCLGAEVLRRERCGTSSLPLRAA
jgi:hypothetical protein